MVNQDPGLATARVCPGSTEGRSDPIVRRATSAASRVPQPGLHHLPVELTSFVGRELELQSISARLSKTRLVSLIGTGGCGKTRLACQVGRRAEQSYGAGVWLVELGNLADPKLVPDTVARALGVPEPRDGETLVSMLSTVLEEHRLLLIFDNCEHLLEASAVLIEALLRACPGLHVLATSRQALGIAGEGTIVVPSLELPARRPPPDAAGLGDVESVRLFVERARDRQPGFAATDENPGAVADICIRLDGIPLALELAAAWMRVLSPHQLAERLDDQFTLLIGTSRTAPRRHQTLRALIDWSYELLTEPERVLFRRLAVFAGSWELEAAEALCATDGGTVAPLHVLELLAALVDKSVVQSEPSRTTTGTNRFRLLGPVREYAHERLRDSGEEATIRDRHRDWLVALVAAAEESWRAAAGASWLARLDLELDNLRAAFAWSRVRAVNPEGTQASGEHEVQTALVLASSLWWFWLLRGHLGEGREHLRGFLRLADGMGLAASTERARALHAAGRLAQVQGDLTEAAELLEASLVLWQAAGSDLQRADLLHDLGLIAHADGDLQRAEALQVEVLALARQREDSVRIYRSLYHLAEVAADLGQHQRAELLLDEALRRARAAGDARGTAIAAADLGRVLRAGAAPERAAQLYVESVQLLGALGDRRRLAASLLGLAAVALDLGEVEHAARLGGIAEGLTRTAGASPPPGWTTARDQLRKALDVAAGDLVAVEAAWICGRSLESEEAMRAARSARHRPDRDHPDAQPAELDSRSPLSGREHEVAGLVAEGYSNSQIAERLTVSRRTADTHVQHILVKLGLHTRAQVAAWVVGREAASAIQPDRGAST